MTTTSETFLNHQMPTLEFDHSFQTDASKFSDSQISEVSIQIFSNPIDPSNTSSGHSYSEVDDTSEIVKRTLSDQGDQGNFLFDLDGELFSQQMEQNFNEGLLCQEDVDTTSLFTLSNPDQVGSDASIVGDIELQDTLPFLETTPIQPICTSSTIPSISSDTYTLRSPFQNGRETPEQHAVTSALPSPDSNIEPETGIASTKDKAPKSKRKSPPQTSKKKSVRHKKPHRRWTAEETEKLKLLIPKYKNKSGVPRWKELAKELPNKDRFQCLKRAKEAGFYKVENHVKHVLWHEEEIEFLTEKLIEEHKSLEMFYPSNGVFLFPANTDPFWEKISQSLLKKFNRLHKGRACYRKAARLPALSGLFTTKMQGAQAVSKPFQCHIQTKKRGPYKKKGSYKAKKHLTPNVHWHMKELEFLLNKLKEKHALLKTLYPNEELFIFPIRTNPFWEQISQGLLEKFDRLHTWRTCYKKAITMKALTGLFITRNSAIQAQREKFRSSI